MTSAVTLTTKQNSSLVKSLIINNTYIQYTTDVHTPTHTCMHTLTHTQTHTHKHAHTCTHTPTHAHTHIHTYIDTYTCMHAHIHTHTRTHTHTHAQTYTHTHTHTHKGMCIAYCKHSRLDAVLKTWYNHQGHRLRWLCNILKVSINSIEPWMRAITDLDYGLLAFFWIRPVCLTTYAYLCIFWPLDHG